MSAYHVRNVRIGPMFFSYDTHIKSQAPNGFHFILSPSFERQISDPAVNIIMDISLAVCESLRF